MNPQINAGVQVYFGGKLESLTFEQLRLVAVLYTSALFPPVLLGCLYLKGLLANWVPKFYILMIVVCAVGWELWFSYGILHGDEISIRRSEILNFYIPADINWLLNSMADSGAIICGLLWLVWILNDKDSSIFREWNWFCFLLILMLFVVQNLIVEMFLYHDQLAVDKTISWAPLSPLANWINPMLFEFKGRTVMLQTQLPWIILAPILYGGLIKYLGAHYPILDESNVSFGESN